MCSGGQGVREDVQKVRVKAGQAFSEQKAEVIKKGSRGE